MTVVALDRAWRSSAGRHAGISVERSGTWWVAAAHCDGVTVARTVSRERSWALDLLAKKLACNGMQAGLRTLTRSAVEREP